MPWVTKVTRINPTTFHPSRKPIPGPPSLIYAGVLVSMLMVNAFDLNFCS
jgi:hypothetical protein